MRGCGVLKRSPHPLRYSPDAGKVRTGRLRWGILGTARIAEQRVVPAISASRNGELAAVSSGSGGEQDFAAQLGTPAPSPLTTRCAPTPTWTPSHPLPNARHREWVLRAPAAGKHVLCEIPLALSLEGGRSLAELARSRGRALMVAHTQRFYPPLVDLRRRILAGDVEPRHVVVRYGFRRHENVGWTGRRRTWTDNLLWHHGGHAIDTTLWLLNAAEVAARGELGPAHPKTGIPMDVGIVLRTAREELATLALSYNTHRPVQDYLVIGERQTLMYTDNRLLGPTGEVLSEEGADDPVKDGVLIQDREFMAAISTGRSPSPSADDVLPCLAVQQSVQDSAAALSSSR